MIDVKDYEDKFAVTEDGKVWSKRSNRFLKQHKNNSGYSMVWFKVDGKNNAKTVHRLIAKAFIPNKNNLPQVNHKDGNKDNNSVENLEWCTVGYNMKHSWKKGLRISTEAHKEGSRANGRLRAAFSDDQIRSIREEAKTTTYKDIAKKYGVVHQTIHKIVKRLTYQHI